MTNGVMRAKTLRLSNETQRKTGLPAGTQGKQAKTESETERERERERERAREKTHQGARVLRKRCSVVGQVKT